MVLCLCRGRARAWPSSPARPSLPPSSGLGAASAMFLPQPVPAPRQAQAVPPAARSLQMPLHMSAQAGLPAMASEASRQGARGSAWVNPPPSLVGARNPFPQQQPVGSISVDDAVVNGVPLTGDPRRVDVGSRLGAAGANMLPAPDARQQDRPVDNKCVRVRPVVCCCCFCRILTVARHALPCHSPKTTTTQNWRRIGPTRTCPASYGPP